MSIFNAPPVSDDEIRDHQRLRSSPLDHEPSQGFALASLLGVFATAPIGFAMFERYGLLGMLAAGAFGLACLANFQITMMRYAMWEERPKR